MESHGRPTNKNAFRRFQKFLVRKRFKMPVRSRRLHRAGGIGLLRAAVLGANDGILSTSSLLLGVAAAHGTHRSILVAGIAGLVSGGMSIAASEYVSDDMTCLKAYIRPYDCGIFFGRCSKLPALGLEHGF
jgi:hypothetical protein